MEGCDIIRRFDVMQADRSIWESHWREVAELVLPRSDWFRNSARNAGDKHTDKLFDSTAPLALERFSAAIESMVTPRTQRWHGLRPRNPEIAEVQEVKVWCDQAVEIMFKTRYSPRANFASQSNDVYTSLGAFGTGGIFTDELPGHGIRYRSVHLSELCIAEDHQGVVDTVMRKMQLTARQAVQRFGPDALSDKINQDAEKSPEAQHEFIHAVYPNSDRKADRKDYKGMAYASCYVEAQTKQIVSEGGYRRFPYAVSRYMTGPKEIYGRSPAMTVLAEIKMANEMSKTIIRAGQLTVNPPILLQEDGALTAFNHRAGALNFGGLDDQGRDMAKPFNTGARVDIGEDMVERRRKAINDAFLVTLFQILVESPAMTATEAMLRAQEKGALLAPTMGRIQSEFLGPLIERELDIMYHAGMLPPMPDVLAQHGGLLDVEYVSPLNRAQRAEEGVAIMRTLESMTPLAQVDPSVMDLFIPEDIGRELADINGMPSKLLRTKEQLQAIKGQRAQSQQAQQLMEAAPVVSSSLKNMAQAQAMAASAPSQQAGNIFAGGGQ